MEDIIMDRPNSDQNENEYQIGNIINFRILYKKSYYSMIGKVANCLTRKVPSDTIQIYALVVYIADNSIAPFKSDNVPKEYVPDDEMQSKDYDTATVLKIPLRFAGKIIEDGVSMKNLVFNKVGPSFYNWLVKITDPEDLEIYAVGRLLDIGSTSNKGDVCYVKLPKKQNKFIECRVQRYDARGGVFVEADPKANIVVVPSSNVLLHDISEIDRNDRKLYQAQYMKIIVDKLLILKLKRQGVNAIKFTDDDETRWYGFTKDNMYISSSQMLRKLNVEVNKDFLTFGHSGQIDDDEDQERCLAPKVNGIIYVKALNEPKKDQRKSVYMMDVLDYEGFDVFHSFFQTEGKHKMFQGKKPSQIISMCYSHNGDPTVFSDLIMGYFHKETNNATIKAFKCEYLWYFY